MCYVRSMPNPETDIVRISKAQQKEHIVDIANHISEVLYYFFEENEDFSTDEQVEEFVLYIWDIAVLCMGALNLKVIGETKDGKILAELNPVESIKQMLIEKSFGEDGEAFYEEEIDESDASADAVDLGDWENIFLSASE